MHTVVKYMAAVIAVVMLTGAGAPTARAADVPNYGQVYALFSRHCMACHNTKDAEGGLILESRANLLKGGDSGAAIIAGKAGDSLLVKLIEHRDKPFMPPPKKGDRLSDAEITLIRAWIDGGAPGLKPGEALPRLPIAAPKIEPKVATRKSIGGMAALDGGKQLAAARGGDVDIIAADHRGLLRRLSGHRGPVNALAATTDGKHLAAAAGEPGRFGEVRLWSLADGSLLRIFEGHSDAIYSIAISADGAVLATGSYDQRIILWNVATGEVLRELDGHNGAIFGLAFRADGRVLASASADRTVKLWDVKTGDRLDTLSQPTREVNAIAFSPDGRRLFAGSTDNRIRTWRISDSAKEGTDAIAQTVFAHEGAILRLVLSADGATLVSTADDGTVKVWRAGDLSPVVVLEKQPDWPTAAAFVNGGQVVVGRLDGSLAFYNAADGKLVPPPKPELSAAEPMGVQRGARAKVKLTGKNLGALDAIKPLNPQLNLRVLDSTSEHATVEIAPPADLAPGAYQLQAVNPGGASGLMTIHIDDLPQVYEAEPNGTLAEVNSPQVADVKASGVSFWGRLTQAGDVDHFAFEAAGGQPLVLDVAGNRLGGKGDLTLTLLDATGRVLAASNGFDGQADPLIVYTTPSAGRYVAKVSELQRGGSNDHYYRVSIGTLPVVTGCFPLSVPPHMETSVRLLGFNLPEGASAKVAAGAGGEAVVPIDPYRYRSRRGLSVLVEDGKHVLEAEPNDEPAQTTPLSPPAAAAAVAHGSIVSTKTGRQPDVDLYRFDAKAGEQVVIETMASRRGSPVDTRIDVLDAAGKPVPRMLLRAVRDSVVTFRPIDANANGVRLPNWEEMSQNDYLYMNGEVVKLFLPPRGPDSQWDFYMSPAGKRRSYFDTTATAHALDEPCYIVESYPPAAAGGLPANGLPVFVLHYANDDDGERRLGTDSRLLFTASADASYVVRVSDTQGNSGERCVYRLLVRPARPDFAARIEGVNPQVPAGTAREFIIKLDRMDGFEGPVRVDITGAPPGFLVTTPIVVEAGHDEARGAIYAAPDAAAPALNTAAATTATATAMVGNEKVAKPIGGLGSIALAGKPQVSVTLSPVADGKESPAASLAADLNPPAVIIIEPGQEIAATLRIERHAFKDIVSFDVQNLPHGIIVSDIGLNGVQVMQDQSQRRIFLTCAPWVQPTERLIFAKAREAGSPASRPVLLRVSAANSAGSDKTSRQHP